MSSKNLKVNSKDLKEVIFLTSILSFKLLLIKTLTKDPDNSSVKNHSDF